MKHVLGLMPIVLKRRALHRIEVAKGREVTCLKGVVWITQANDARDIVLQEGQCFLLDRRGLAVVFALEDAAILVSAPGEITALGRKSAQVPARPHAA